MPSCTNSACAGAVCHRHPDARVLRLYKRCQTVEYAFMRLGLAGIIIALMLAACATSPPVQEMADARSAIQTAKQIPHTNLPAEVALKSAEQMLSEAAEAIRKEHYEQARQMALGAKRKAQRAVQYKQQKQKP